MNILYAGYWSVRDVLTQAVILPRLEILSSLPEVRGITFCTIERFAGNIPLQNPFPSKVKHVAFYSKKNGMLHLQKFDDFTRGASFLRDVLRKEKFDLIICNSPLAGVLGYRVWKSTNIPFLVECFEPHAQYMAESGVWRTWGVRYLTLRHFEKLQKKYAWRLLTVSSNYSRRLTEEGVDPGKIKLMPNGLDTKKFAFDPRRRNDIRRQLNIASDSIVGIYVGKFGGIYYDKEAFELFAFAFHFFEKKFNLIILSDHPGEEIREKLRKAGIDLNRTSISCVQHDEVPDYLSAADFAFATIKPAPSRRYCCPVKNGEYWASGLPILLGNGIGDDSGIIQNEGGGVLLDMLNPNPAFRAMDNLIKKGRSEIAKDISSLATKYRDLSTVETVYRELVSEFRSSNFH